MRRLTLGVCILAVGTLLALPFRRPVGDAPAPSESLSPSTRQQLLDDRSLQLLVEEVTRDVEIPAAYDPQTDYAPPRPGGQPMPLPLTYEDTAVPVLEDPLYRQRFNATVAIASPHTEPASPPQSANSDDRRALRFTRKPAVAPDVAAMLGNPVRVRPISASGPSPSAFSRSIPTLPQPEASPVEEETRISQAGVDDRAVATPSGRSILSPLPPPDEASRSTNPSRQRHWIRQPD